MIGWVWPRRGILFFVAAATAGVPVTVRAMNARAMSPVPKEIKLNSGNSIPTIGLGVFLVKGSREIRTGLSVGYR